MTFYELTEPQKLIWINEQLFPDTSLHGICCAAVIEEAIDASLLEAAIGHYVRDTSALRTVLDVRGGMPLQAFDEGLEIRVVHADLRGDGELAGALRRFGEREAARPFRLAEEPLARVVIARLAENKTALLLNAHHLIADAYSTFLFLRGVSRHYRSLAERGRPAEGEARCYSAIVQGETEYRNSARYETDRAFWAERLDRLQQGTLFGGCDLLSTSTLGRRLTFEWPEELVRRLLLATSNARTSLYGTILGILGSVVARSLGTGPVCIGSPFINRPGAAALKTFGMTVNTMPVVLHAEKSVTLQEYIRRAGSEIGACLRRGYFPFHHARHASSRFASGQPMFDIGLSYQNANFASGLELRVGDMQWFFPGHEMNALTVHAHDRSRQGRLSFDLDYRTSVFTESQVRSIFDALTMTAEDLVTSSEGAERAWVSRPITPPVSYEGEPAPETPEGFVTDWLVRSADAQPDAIALREGGTVMTYRTLVERALRCRERLRVLGVSRGDSVIVLAKRSIDTVTAILGILFAGAAYVPVTNGTPAARLEKIQTRTSARVLLAPADAEVPALSGVHREPLESACAWRDVGTREPVRGDEASYVLFTSGSTGEPKGVVVDHGGLRHYLAFAMAAYGNGRAVHMPLFTSLGFDLTVTALFVPLITGGTLHVYPDALDDEGKTLRTIFEDDACDTIKLTPSHLRLVDALSLSSPRLRTLILGGEQLPNEMVEKVAARLGPGVTFVNEYGPTEAVVGCVYHRWSKADMRHPLTPIGLPIAGTPVRVMTAWNQYQLRGFRGELEIGGPGLARGYLDDPAQTSEKFISDGEARWYRSGDIVVEDGGVLHCMGRRDRQIKHLGFRIELADVEAALSSHADVTASYALHVADRRQLLVFYTGTPSPEAALLEHMRQELPSYAVPSRAIHCESLPLNAHGKVDEGALRAKWESSGPQEGYEQELPEEELPRRVLEIIGEVLSVDARALLGQTFATAGGDSVNAIHVVSKLRALGVGTKVSELLGAPSLGDFARRARSTASEGGGAPETGILAQPLPMQRWFLGEAFAAEAHYHQSILLESKDEIDIVAAREALQHVVATHDALRLNLDEARRLYFNDKHLTEAPPFDAFDVPEGQDHEAFMAREGARIKEGFDLTRDPLLRGACFRTADTGTWILLCAHHLAVDIASWFVLVEDWLRAYRARRAGTSIVLPRPRTSIRQWAEHLSNRPLSSTSAAYWNRVRAEIEQLPELRHHEAPGALWVQENVVLSATKVGSFFDPKVHEPYATKPHELVLAAVAGAAAAALDIGPIVVEYESHGRLESDEHDLARTVGWFTSQFPLVIRNVGGDALRELVTEVKDGLRNAPDGGTGWMREPRPGLRPAVKFNFVGSALQLSESEIRLSNLDSGPDRSPMNEPPEAVEAVVFREGDDCRVQLSFSHRRFDAAARQRFTSALERCASAILTHCTGQTDRSFTTSDFGTLDLSGDDLSALFET